VRVPGGLREPSEAADGVEGVERDMEGATMRSYDNFFSALAA